MKKGVGPIGLTFLAILVSVISSGIIFLAFYNRTSVSKRALIEINTMDGVNKFELSEMGLLKALEYSFYQSAYLTSPRGGYYTLGGIDSYNCVPYWRVNGVKNFPHFTSMSNLMVKLMNNYAEELNITEVELRKYVHHYITRNFDGTTAKVFRTDGQKTKLDRDKLDIVEDSDLEKSMSNNIATMYYDIGKRNFVDSDPIRSIITRVETLMAHAGPYGANCKEITFCDGTGECKYNDKYVCENNIPNAMDVLNYHCPNWQDSMYQNIQVELYELKTTLENRYPGFEVNIFVEGITVPPPAAETSYTLGDERSEDCGCEISRTGHCSYIIGDETGCFFAPGCSRCYDSYNNFVCCYKGGNQECQRYPVLEGTGWETICTAARDTDGDGELDDTYTYCELHKRVIKELKYNYEYFASVGVLVEIKDVSGNVYPVYSLSSRRTELNPITLRFRVFSGNNYHDITSVALSNPSFEGGVYQQTSEQFVPNGWSLVNNDGTYAEAKTLSNAQLPEVERIGQPRALILDGDHCYKIFNSWYTFDVSLEQTLNVPSGALLVVEVPTQVHLHYEEVEGITDPFAAQIKMVLNGAERDFWGVDRTWVHAYAKGVADTNGADLEIHAISRYADIKDFFFDNVRVYQYSYDSAPLTNACNNEALQFP